MILRAIFREAWRNILSGTTRVVLLTLLLAAASTTLIAAELTTVHTIVRSAAEYQAAGASITTISAPGRIDPNRCVALGTLPGVRAAGAIRQADTKIVAAALPSTSIPHFHTTPGFADVLHATRVDNAGVILSDQAAEALALAPGDSLATIGFGDVAVAGVYAYPNDGRRPGFGYAVLAEVPTAPINGVDAVAGSFDECWLDVWPANPQVTSLLNSTLLPGSEQEQTPQVAQLNGSLGRSFHGAELYAERLTRFAPAVAAIFGVILGFIALRLRRIHIASALHLGVRRRDVTLMVAIEQLAWVLPALLLMADVTAWFLVTGPADEVAVTVRLAGAIAGCAVLGTVFGAMFALLTTRERHLFRYFKER